MLPFRVLLSLAFCLPLLAQDPFEDPFAASEQGQSGGSTSTAELLIDSKAIAPGTPFTISLKLTHPPGWHSYFHNDGLGVSKVPTITWELPKGFTAGELQWPTPHRTDFFGSFTYSYLDTTYFSSLITPPADLPVGQEVAIGLKADWQTCKESCIDETFSESLTLPVQANAESDTAVRSVLDAYNQRQVPGATPEDWIVSAEDDGTNITLRIKTGKKLLEDLFFYDFDRQIDPQAKQEFTSPEPGLWELVVPRSTGKELGGKPGPILPRLKGILAGHEDLLPGSDRPAVWIQIAFLGNGDSNPPPSDTAAPADGAAVPSIPAVEQSLLKILGLAFLGGLILNLMPCVFPVLGLKIMGFVQQAGDDPARIKKHGLVFAAGLLVSLWILAGILIALVVIGGQYLGWGFQLNDPRFLAVMIMIFFVMALNLSGLFELGTSMTGVGGNLAHKKGYSGSFFSGILTTLVATPCTGPFLGVAMTFALQQPIHISFLVFTTLGLGIASPYLLLSFSPKLLNKLPRPGAWMETFKKALAFPLYLAVVYFLNGFGAQTGRSGMIWLLTAMVVIAIALWIYGNWSTPGRSKRARAIGAVAAILIGVLGLYTTSYAVQRSPEGSSARGTHLGNFEAIAWEPGIVTKLRKGGQTVFIDYTADT